MKRLVHSRGYARAKFVNGLIFIGLGIAIVVEFAAGVGARFEALAGYALGAALLALGALRLKAGWPR